MGRFYQTAKPEFIDDFIYQPPWELIQQNNMLEAQNYADQLKNINILGTPIRFWDKPDGEKALEIQREIDAKTNEFTQALKNDPNSEKTQQAIRDYSRQMRERYQAGDIYKIQKQKDTYDKYMEYAEKLPPGEKEIFLRQVDNYLKPNINGTVNNALTTPFNYMEHQTLVTADDYFKTDRFKTLEADINANTKVNVGGKWITKTSTNETELKKEKISEDMKAWLQEQGFDKNNAAKYWNQVNGIQNLYDKEGNLGFEKGTYLGDMIDTASTTHAYSKIIKDEDKDVNQWSMFYAQQAAAAQAAYDETSQDAEASPSVKSNRMLKVNAALQEQLVNDIRNTFLSQGLTFNITPKNLLSTIEKIKKDPNYLKEYQSLRKVVLNMYNKMDQNSITSRQQFYQLIGDKTKADGYITNAERLWHNERKFYIGFDPTGKVAGEEGYVSNSRFSYNDIKNAILKKGGFKIGNQKVVDITIPKEITPTMVSNDIGYNYYTRYATATVEEVVENKTVKTLKTFPVHIPISELNQITENQR